MYVSTNYIFWLLGYFGIRSLPNAILVSTWFHFGSEKNQQNRVSGRLASVLSGLGSVLGRLGGVLDRLGPTRIRFRPSWPDCDAQGGGRRGPTAQRPSPIGCSDPLRTIAIFFAHINVLVRTIHVSSMDADHALATDEHHANICSYPR